MPDRAPTIQIPRWIQLVGLPILLLLAWTVAGAVRHALFVFLVATLVALLLSPVVRALARGHVRRGVAVAAVYLVFAGAVAVAIGAVGTVVVDETRTAATRMDDYFTVVHGRQTRADRDVDRFQQWLDTHHLRGIEIRERGHDLVRQIRDKDVGRYTKAVVDFVEGAAVSVGKTLFALVLIVVVSIYMLLDFPRLARLLDCRFPPRAGSRSLLTRMEHAVAGYVKGQLAASLIIGASAGFALWLFGVGELLPNADRYALLFGAWVGATELIPYIGPWLGGIPPFLYALFTHPIGALWVLLLFLFIHQVEGHVVVPNVMSRAVRLHPLLVIFGLLAGGEIYGLPGVLVALPLLAAGRAVVEFFAERVSLEAWPAGAAPVPVEVALEAPALDEQPTLVERAGLAEAAAPEPPAPSPL